MVQLSRAVGRGVAPTKEVRLQEREIQEREAPLFDFHAELPLKRCCTAPVPPSGRHAKNECIYAHLLRGCQGMLNLGLGQ